MLGRSGATFLNKMPGIPQFSGTDWEKNTVRFEQWLHSISDARKNVNNQWVRAAINKSCVEDVADAICSSKSLNGCIGPWNLLTL